MIKRISILDMAPVHMGSDGRTALLNAIDLAKRADDLGYERYWVTEHHNIDSVASAAPEVLIGQLAANTKRIRVGSGGVMLPNHSPLKVAENFKLLETFYPGRIDLGVGRAPGTDGLTSLAIRRSQEPLHANDFHELLQELKAYDANAKFADNHPFVDIIAMPKEVELPPLWILGSSAYSAQLAAKEAMSYAYAYHFNPSGAKEAIHMYRYLHKDLHGEEATKGKVILGVSVIGGETEKDLEYIKKKVGIRYLKGLGFFKDVKNEQLNHLQIPAELQYMVQSYLSTQIMGTWNELKMKLDTLAEEMMVEELMITAVQDGFPSRLRLYEKLAELYHL